MEKRKSIKSKWTSGKRTSTRKARKRHQNGTQEPKIGPKKAVNGTTRGQKWFPEGPKRVQKRSQTASRTKKRIKSIPRPSWTRQRADPPAIPSPPGGHLGTPKRPKTEPKTIHKRNENQEAKRGDPRRSRTHLGAILSTFGSPCGCPKPPKVLENVLFREQTRFGR